MKFTLYYNGKIKSNGTSNDKHKLRKFFHPQLKKLWHQKPLSHFTSFYNRPDIENSISRQIESFTFVPLICEAFHLVARLDVTFLRPEPPGSIITQGGDIDNRLKTLLDSLKIPTEPNALPKKAKPDADDKFFFCLLEDDNLITEISVNTKQLLVPSFSKGELITIIDVETIKIGTLMGGMELP